MTLYIIFGGLGYLLIAVFTYIFCEDVVQFNDEIGNILWAVIWPLFIIFWLFGAFPAIGVYRFLKYVAKKLRRGFRKTHTSEVK